MNKRTALVSLVAGGAMVLTGCSGYDWDSAPDYYKPRAFGEKNKCYYAKYRSEAEKLKKEGFCKDGWVPTVMPTYWLNMYAPYYFSSEYRNYYVPKSKRGLYKSYGTSYTIKHNEAIRKAQAKAVYTDNNGKKVNGNKVDLNKFGGGSKSKGGSGVRICAAGEPGQVVVALGGGRGGSSGGFGGSRGGSSRSGGFGGSKGGSSGSSGGWGGGSGKAKSGVTRGGC
ncbi:hypothetical protein SEA_BILLNYE_215 [Streptomyces phage BillNye]|uniref:Lipoprotein n=1 Tax=Streptomyces phage BillNye TaxID=2079426 RepID=A0A2L1IW37_9CAUD|nr:hypothetical protein FDJ30_gp047 [Streptomyces phage BillNye]AVD99386.1 hypothetical protein SEA_BILLNYE_215 [Streptomyces phage BillNye]